LVESNPIHVQCVTFREPADVPLLAVDVGVTKEGVKRVDVDELYDIDTYLPKVRHVLGKPMFLY
jgi:hypothetical protein